MNDYTTLNDRNGKLWKKPRVRDLKEYIKDLDDNDIVAVYEGEVTGITFSAGDYPHAETKFFKTRPR